MRLYIFDVDGTLHCTRSGGQFRETAHDWEWMPGRLEKLSQLRKQGAIITLCTNQRGVCFPWSKFTEEQIQTVLDACAAEIGASIVKVSYASTHAKALDKYRVAVDERSKPSGAMVSEILDETGIAKEDALFIGDRDEDKACAEAAGVAFQWAHEFFQ